MIKITNKQECCGCNACGDICPKDSIAFKKDKEGFLYPEVDTDSCIDCHLCEKVCPIINIDKVKQNEYSESECYAAIHKNLEVRFDSTSGGLFTALAENTYKAGGYVGGAIFTKEWGVQQFVSSDKNNLEALRSSKYLQSDAQGFYKKIKDLVITGEKVLVCGTPCQMAALRCYLGKEYDNIIIIDFICRGVNSPKVFRKYLDYLEERFGAKVIFFKAKNKELGWRALTSKVVFENGKVLYDTEDTSYFTKGYLCTGVYCRPSCYTCKFKGFPRMADITIADFWGAERIVGDNLDNDLGTSLVMLNNSKGKRFFSDISNKIISEKISLNDALKDNPALTKSLNPPIVDRDSFYRDLDNYPFKVVAEKYIDPKNVNLSWKRIIKNIIKFIILIVRVSQFDLHNIFKNLYYNLFSKCVNADIKRGIYLIINKNCILELHEGSKINLKSTLTLGWRKFQKTQLETRLLIQTGGILNVGGKGAVIGYGSDIEIFENAIIDIKGGVATNINATMICAERIVIGENAIIGRDVTIRDNNGGHFIARRGYKNSHPIVIGQHAWLCEGCTVIGGAKIGDGVIVGAKSLVASHIPSFTMVSGVPAQVVDEDVYWKY